MKFEIDISRLDILKCSHCKKIKEAYLVLAGFTKNKKTHSAFCIDCYTSVLEFLENYVKGDSGVKKAVK